MPIIGRLFADDAREFGHDRSIRFIRARYLIAYFVLAFIVTIAAILIFALPELRRTGMTPIITSTVLVTFNVLLFAMLFFPARRTGIRIVDFVPVMSARAARWSIGTACALFIVAFGTVYILYLPLSFVFPGYVEHRLLGAGAKFYGLEGDRYVLSNTINFMAVVVLGPIVEEYFFRGLLLRVWITKWGVRRAIVYSSMLFSLLHADHLGAFLIAVVLSLSYIWSRRIQVPILIHMSYNLIFSLYAGGYLAFVGYLQYTLAEFQAEWWTGALGLIVGVPALIWFLRKGAPVAAVTPT